MKTVELGFACIHQRLDNLKPRVYTNRRMRRAAWLADPAAAYAKSLLNAVDLQEILHETGREGIRLFRFSSGLIVGGADLPPAKYADAALVDALEVAGGMAGYWNVRVTTHPGPFEMLASPQSSVQEYTRSSLAWHAWVMDRMQLPLSPHAKINVHLGGTYGDKRASLRRAIAAFKQLPSNVRHRLTVENDDRERGYHVEDLLEFSRATGCPVVFDYHHFALANPSGMPLREAVDACVETWTRRGVKPCFHQSSARTPGSRAHADFVVDRIENFGHAMDVVLEAKAKNDAVWRYYELFPEQMPRRLRPAGKAVRP